MKINPTMSKGIVLMHQDGSYEMAPFQVFRGNNATIIRIGNNTLFFEENGKFDGSECGGVPKEKAEEFMRAFEIQDENKDKAPDKPYFEPGSNGWEKETADWPKDMN